VGAFFNRDGLASSNADTFAVSVCGWDSREQCSFRVQVSPRANSQDLPAIDPQPPPCLPTHPLSPQQRNYDRKRTRANIATASIPKAKTLWVASVDVWPDWGYPGTYTQFVIYGAKYKRTYVKDAGGQFIDGNSLLSTYPAVAKKEWWSESGAYQNIAINQTEFPATAKQALLSVLRQADVIIDETFFGGPVNARDMAWLLPRYGLTQSDVATIPAFANKRVSSSWSV